MNPKIPATDVTSLVAYARERPGQLSYSSAGIGTTVHLAYVTAEVARWKAVVDRLGLAL